MWMLHSKMNESLQLIGGAENKQTKLLQKSGIHHQKQVLISLEDLMI